MAAHLHSLVEGTLVRSLSQKDIGSPPHVVPVSHQILVSVTLICHMRRIVLVHIVQVHLLQQHRYQQALQRRIVRAL